ncbi:hypothetical protein B0H13DRAFT_2564870 [Mycena leptocephala]|nr:hypothetical protein B0H13DRAFT_2564870 [Mycena leptocephala]
MAVSLIATNLATLAIGSLFYGSYLVLFFISLYLLLRRYDTTHTSHKSRQNSSVFTSTVFVSAICLFLVVTAVRKVVHSFSESESEECNQHWTTIVYRSFIAFVALQQGADAEKFFNDHTQFTEIIQNSFMSLSVLIGDSLISKRGLIVIALPTASLITLTDPTVGSFVSLNITLHSTDVFGNPLLKINTVLTLVINVYCTAFIAWKIWIITRETMPVEGSNLRHFLVIVVESAGLYACWAVFFAVAYETESNVQSCVIQTAPALVGIVNALIHTRVGLGWTSEQAERLPWPASPLRFAGRDAIGE